jgi:hypothetical protein
MPWNTSLSYGPGTMGVPPPNNPVGRSAGAQVGAPPPPPDPRLAKVVPNFSGGYGANRSITDFKAQGPGWAVNDAESLANAQHLQQRQAQYRAAHPEQFDAQGNPLWQRPPQQSAPPPPTTMAPAGQVVNGDPRNMRVGSAGPDPAMGGQVHGDPNGFLSRAGQFHGGVNSGGFAGPGTDPSGGFNNQVWGDPRLGGVTGQVPLNLNGRISPDYGFTLTPEQMNGPGGQTPGQPQMVYDSVAGNPVGRGTGAPGYPGAPQPQSNPGATNFPYPGTPGAPQPFNPFGGTPQGNTENRNVNQVGLDPRLDSLYQYALQQAMQRYADPNGSQFYGGPTVAGFNTDDLAAQGQLRQAAGMVGGSAGSGLNFMNTMMGRATNPMMDPVLNSNIDAMTRDTLQSAYDPNGVFGQIDDSSLNNGSFGGTRQGVAQGVAQGRLADVIAKNSAMMRLGGQQQNIQAALGALGQTPNSLALATAPATMTGAVGQQERAMQQAQFDDQLRRWGYNTTEPDRRLQNLFSMIGAAPLGGYQTGSSTIGHDLIPGANGGTSGWQQALGGIAGGSALWSLLSPFFNNG